MLSKLERYIKFLPKELKPATNPILSALLRAWAGEDEEVAAQLQNTKAQLFVKTAEGTYLDRLASNYGVSRPPALGLLDDDFRNLIPNFSLKQKQVAKSFYDTMDVFWGPKFSRANAVASLNEPYPINPGDYFEIKVDGQDAQKASVLSGDVRIPGAATAREAAKILRRMSGFTVDVTVDPSANKERIELRTDTPGPRGSLEFIAGFGTFGFVSNQRVKITDQAQRTLIYQVNPGEVIIEIPAIVPSLRRTLKGSHHFHEDSSVGGSWKGSFLYSTTAEPFVVTGTKTTLSEAILAGSVLSEITVGDSSGFPSSGELIFNFGRDLQEQPVSYIAVPNSRTILVDPGYSFQKTHPAGSSVNLLMPGQINPYEPRIGGADLPIYFVSPVDARSAVQDLLQSLTAAGIIVSFVILLPTYRYLIENPYAE